MPKPSSKSILRFSLLGAAFFLGACNTTEPGLEDFGDAKVDARTAGKSLVDGFNLGKEWSAAAPEPAMPLSLGLSAPAGVLRKSTALPVRELGADFKLDLEDTAKGYATLTLETAGLLATTRDTVVVRWDDRARDAVQDNENILRCKRVTVYVGGKVETVAITDADDNGLVNPVPGVNNKARFVFSTSQGGATETADLIVGSGADGEFEAEGDNTVYKALWTREKGGDVVARGEFLDGDNDGLVADNSKDSRVVARWFERNPAGRPLVKRVDAEARLDVLANKAGDEPVSFSYTEEMKSGRINAVSMKNRHGGDEFIRNDTLWVKVETTRAAAGDTLKHAELVVVMNPGENLKSRTDDLVYAIHVKSRKKLGFERSAEFSFIAGEPVPHGKEPISGVFDGKAVYANGQSAALKGEFSPAGFSAEFTGPEGNSVKVEFARSGDVL